MKENKLLSGFLALGVAMTTFSGLIITADATKGPETGVYLCRTTLEAGQYMRDNLEIMEGEQTVGEEGCVAHFSSEGVLTLGSTLTLNEAREGSLWGAIGGVVGASDLTIQLLPSADITVNSTGYSGLYGNYEPLLIKGDGKLTINTSGNSEGAILIYGKDGSADSVPTGVTITDGADVSVSGTKGIVFTGGADGDISVTNGATLTVETTGKAFSKEPKIQQGSTVTVGSSASGAAAWDGKTSLTEYTYVKIEAPDSAEECSEPPSEEPIVSEPAVIPDPDMPTENFSKWVGIQTERDGKIEWLYDGHYIMPDGSHLNQNTHGKPDGSEAVSYYSETGTLTFNKDITIYGASDSSEYKTYYGSGISCVQNTNLIIHLNDGVNVTIDALNRDSYSYLYGLYSNGHLVIEGDGTLTVKSNNGSSDNYALCVFNGQEFDNSGSILIKNNANVVLENMDENGIGIGLYGSGAGDIVIKDGGKLETTGGKQALGKAPVIPEEASVKVGSSASDAVLWDGITDITSYKYVKIDAEGTDEPEPPIQSEEATTPTPNPPTEAPTKTEAPTQTEAPTPSVPPELPTIGVLWSDDFEDYFTYDYDYENIKAMKIAEGGDYNNIYEMNIDIAEGHGKVLKATTDKTANRGFDFYPKDVYGLSEHEDINSGTLVISADVCIPAGFVMNSEDQEINDYIWTWSKDALSGKASNNKAYVFKVGTAYGDTKGRISFQTSTPINVISTGSTNGIDIDFDTWHSIDTVVNYDAGTVDYYVDGNLVTSYPGSPDDVKKYFSLAYLGLHQNGRFTSSDKPLTILWDNFKLELIDKEFSASTAGSSNNYVDVKFTKPVSDAALKNTTISARQAGNSSATVNAVDYERISGNMVRVFFEHLEPAVTYELIFGNDITSAFGGGTISADTKLVFTTEPEPTSVKLIDMNFDTDEGDFWLVHSKSSEDTSFVDDADKTSDVVSIKDGVLYYDHYLDVSGEERNGLKFPFDGNTVIANGKLIVEFDAGVYGETKRTRAIFGLEDPDKTDSSWTPATVFGGIMPYDGSRLSVSRAMESKRNALTGDSGADITAAITRQDEMHHYKIVIDIDNSKYQLYYDGALAADLDYIPGGNTENSFDAFMLTGVNATSSYSAERGKTFIMLDNLEVTAEKTASTVGNVTFVKYDGTQSSYSSVAPAGTKEIKIDFTKDMAADTSEHVKISGLDETNYTVVCAGKTVTITIDNCLDANAAYTLKVDSNATDSKGEPIAGEALYSFNTDAGEVVYYKPVLRENNGMVTVDVTVINTTANDINDFYITLAGFDADERLICTIPLKASYKRSEGYTKTFTVTGDTETFSKANRAAAFVFSDLTYIRPLTECAEIIK